MTRRDANRWCRSMVLAALTIMAPVPAADAAQVIGTFTFTDTNGPMPIRRANVEVWYHGPNWWDFWTCVAFLKTTDAGTISYSDSRGAGWYSLSIYATNDAAIVWPIDVHLDAFRTEPGPGGSSMHLPVSSASDLLDFSWTFTDDSASRYFNLADTALWGYDYAMARRDPAETDFIHQVFVQPTSWGDFLTGTYYNANANTIMFQMGHAYEDFVLLHEYGHHLEHEISKTIAWASYHDGCQMRLVQGGSLINSPEYAWTEAFSDYFAQAVARAYVYQPALAGTPTYSVPSASRLESPEHCSLIGQATSQAGTITAAMVEIAVAASLWDLLDPVGNPSQGVEAHDTIAGEDVTVFQIFDRELGASGAGNIFLFRNAWAARGKNLAALDCILSAYEILPPRPGCQRTTAVKLVGRFNSDNRSDIALTGVPGWATIPVALSNGDGSFNVVNSSAPDFAQLAAAHPHMSKLIGDFNGDGLTDIALTGGFGMDSIPVALSNGSGAFTVVNAHQLSFFPAQAFNPLAEKLTGDFDGDGDTDIALVGVPNDTRIIVAWSDGAGAFTETIEALPDAFVRISTEPRARRFAADFNGDGKADILVVPFGARLLPLALSLGDGTFYVMYVDSGDFGVWAAAPGAQVLVGDFNGDHIADLAISGPAGWGTVPMLLSHYNSPFTVVNAPVGDFAAWSASPAIRLVGDFNGSGAADIALTGVAGWATVPVAVTNGQAFVVTNAGVGDFAAWAATAGVQPLIGDFNGDGTQDIALTGAAGWGSVPVAFANMAPAATYQRFGTNLLWAAPTGSFATITPAFSTTITFTVTNRSIVDFAAWSALP